MSFSWFTTGASEPSGVEATPIGSLGSLRHAAVFGAISGAAGRDPARRILRDGPIRSGLASRSINKGCSAARANGVKT
jgi:hypothetical protein